MQGLQSRDGRHRLLSTAIRDIFDLDEQRMLSGRLDRLFRFAAWAEIAGILACVYLLWAYYLASISPLQNLSVRVLVGSVGAAAALGSTFLSKAMWNYWRRCDTGSRGLKRLWFFIMSFPPLLGTLAYFFLVYETQAKARRLEK